MGKGKTFATLAGGVAVGAALGVLFAPKSGAETRKELKAKLDELESKAAELDMDDVKNYIEKSIKKIQKELSDLDGEKVEKIAKKKAKEIQNSVSDLVAYAKEKGTPILEEAVEEVRKKAIAVTKTVLDKLEK